MDKKADYTWTLATDGQGNPLDITIDLPKTHMGGVVLSVSRNDQQQAYVFMEPRVFRMWLAQLADASARM